MDVIRISFSWPPGSHVWRWRGARLALARAARVVDGFHFARAQRAAEDFDFVDESLPDVARIVSGVLHGVSYHDISTLLRSGVADVTCTPSVPSIDVELHGRSIVRHCDVVEDACRKLANATGKMVGAVLVVKTCINGSIR